MKKVYDVRYTCSQCPSIPWFPAMIIAADEEQARAEAQQQADNDCKAEHTILSVEDEGIYE